MGFNQKSRAGMLLWGKVPFQESGGGSVVRHMEPSTEACLITLTLETF